MKWEIYTDYQKLLISKALITTVTLKGIYSDPVQRDVLVITSFKEYFLIGEMLHFACISNLESSLLSWVHP